MTGKSMAYRIVATQIGITVLLSVTFLAIWGSASGLAAMVGGLIGAGTNLLLAAIVFRGGVQGAQSVLRRMYLGEGAKILITALCFLTAIAWWSLAVLPLLVGYAATLLIYWLALLPAVPAIKADRA